MKVVKLLLCVVCILIISPSAMAFQNEPDGFRDFKWDTNISKIEDFNQIRNNSDTAGDALVKMYVAELVELFEALIIMELT
ncbi:MAG: hypothetical protein HY809_06205 [Nitrospirae bacterium]|nr:hypothetical protein [Nitrospirota bacterium]